MPVCIALVAVAGGCIGFLPYNFSPAKTFMGDGGALYLGYMIAVLSVISPLKRATVVGALIPMLTLAVPIFDTAFAMLRRMLKHESIMHADKGHLHHRLLDLGFTQRQAVLLMYVISALLGLSAVALTEVSPQMSIAIVCVVISAVLFGAKKIGIFHLNDSAQQH
jgi:UDP-GlcNAc:undecaprenyl-phosphate GlcNAc-1-phosphate transferase